MCLYPKIIKNPKYKKNQKNGGTIPPVQDQRILYLPVGCGNCIECRKQKKREWQVRLQEDIKTHTNAKYITLTFSNQSIKQIHEQHINKTDINGRIVKVPIKELQGYNIDNAIATRAIHLFRERWRKEYGTSIRHWLITELGHKGTENVHMHGLLWTNQTYDDIEKHWQYGFIWPRKIRNHKGIWIREATYVNARTINYTVKYINKVDKQHKEYKPIILTSAGIGRNYTNTQAAIKNKYNGKDTHETYRTNTGHKIAMPAYWRNKIYTETQKEQLWIQKLDKQERWICGVRVTIAEGEKQYFKLLNHFRQLNKQLGYGNDEKNWKRETYENERRNIIITKRIQNTK